MPELGFISKGMTLCTVSSFDKKMKGMAWQLSETYTYTMCID